LKKWSLHLLQQAIGLVIRRILDSANGKQSVNSNRQAPRL